MKNTSIQLIDLTHTLTSNIPHWGTDCGFQNKTVVDYADCQSTPQFKVQHLSMTAGIGTHMDAPSHCFSEGKSISDIPLSDLVVPCAVIDISTKSHANYSVTENDILEYEKSHGTLQEGSFVIIHTGWGKHWNDALKYRNNLIFPCVSEPAAKLLLSRNITGLGIDTLSPDRAGMDFPVHQILLGNGKYIVENVANADLLPPTGCHIGIFPLKIAGGTESPIRLVGLILN